MINSILHFFGCFDLHGVKFPVDHLQRIQRYIPNCERAFQAKYVDRVTKRGTTENAEWLHEFIADTDKERWFLNGWNTTSIGNLAYVSLYHPNTAIRAHANDCLSSLQKWLDLNQKV